VRIRYDGPGRRLYAFGKTLDRGADDEFDAAEVASLLAQPAIHITVLDDDPVEDEKFIPPADPGGAEPEAEPGTGRDHEQEEQA